MKHFPKLFTDYSSGTILTTSILKSQGITPQLAHHYVKQNWLIPLGEGAFLRKGDTPSWFEALNALQALDITVYVGAGSALNLVGMNQNIDLGKPFIHLFTPHKIHLPKWFLKYDFDATFHVTRTQKYNENNLMQIANGRYAFKISTPEKAILEVCRFVPTLYSFEALRNYMEALISINPIKIQEILESTKFIKEKRVFLYMASVINHKWYKKLYLEKINLGKGPRQVSQNGTYNKDHMIFVPKDI